MKALIDKPLSGSVWQHQNGRNYLVLGVIAGVVFYQCIATRVFYWRPLGEFVDGRFELTHLTAPPASDLGFHRG